MQRAEPLPWSGAFAVKFNGFSVLPDLFATRLCSVQVEPALVPLTMIQGHASGYQ